MGGSSKVDGVELHVHVLTTGFWPTQTAVSCHLPPQIAQCCQVFKEHYLKCHSGRRLTWQTNMGNADLKATFRTRKHEINVSTYQARVSRPRVRVSTCPRVMRVSVSTCQVHAAHSHGVLRDQGM